MVGNKNTGKLIPFDSRNHGAGNDPTSMRPRVVWKVNGRKRSAGTAKRPLVGCDAAVGCGFWGRFSDSLSNFEEPLQPAHPSPDPVMRFQLLLLVLLILTVKGNDASFFQLLVAMVPSPVAALVLEVYFRGKTYFTPRSPFWIFCGWWNLSN